MSKDGEVVLNEQADISAGDMASLLTGDGNFDETGGLIVPEGASSPPEPKAEEKIEVAPVEEEEVKVEDELPDGEEEKKPEAEAEAEVEDETPVVLAKDGKNVIPFEVLETERTEKAEALKRIGELEATVSTMQEASKKLEEAQALDEEDGGETDEHVQELLADLEEEKPELVDAVKGLIKQGRVADQKAIKALQDQLTELKEAFEPVKDSTIKTEANSHFDNITKVHADLDDIMAGFDKDGSDIEKFIATKPSFVQDQYRHVIKHGNADQVIELLDAFKDETGYGKEAPKAEAKDESKKSDGKEAAKDAKAKAKGNEKPYSLSDVPAGGEVETDPSEALAETKDPMAMMGRFAGKTPEEIERMISKVV